MHSLSHMRCSRTHNPQRLVIHDNELTCHFRHCILSVLRTFSWHQFGGMFASWGLPSYMDGSTSRDFTKTRSSHVLNKKQSHCMSHAEFRETERRGIMSYCRTRYSQIIVIMMLAMPTWGCFGDRPRDVNCQILVPMELSYGDSINVCKAVDSCTNTSSYEAMPGPPSFPIPNNRKEYQKKRMDAEAVVEQTLRHAYLGGTTYVVWWDIRTPDTSTFREVKMRWRNRVTTMINRAYGTQIVASDSSHFLHEFQTPEGAAVSFSSGTTFRNRCDILVTVEPHILVRRDR